MYFPDLQPLQIQELSQHPPPMAVGWLTRGVQFAAGIVPQEFLDRLESLCAVPVRLTRGFHVCEICSQTPVRGNGEIHVRGANGTIFVAPVMVLHYIRDHKYRPPDDFIEAVMMTEPNPLRVSKLSECIYTLASAPTESERRKFYDLLAASRVGIRVQASGTSTAEASREAEPLDVASIPLARLSTEELMLLVLADIPLVSSLERAACFAEYEAVDMLQAALREHAGVIVQVLYPHGQAWAAVPPEDVSTILEIAGKGARRVALP